MDAAIVYTFLDMLDINEEKKIRTYQERDNVMNSMTDREFITTYRLSKEAVEFVCRQLQHDLEPSRKNTRTALTVQQQVLMALRFFSVGSFLGAIGRDESIRCAKSTVSRTVHRVSLAICKNLAHLISMPFTAEDKMKTKMEIHSKHGMPGCLGLIDGTLIAIQAPIANSRFSEANYFSHKGYHALNTMIVCNPELKICAIDATNPGANHDSSVWSHSKLKGYALRGYFDAGEYLIGDSGYPQEPWLMTPIKNTILGSAEDRYNKAHSKTRNIVEHCIGLLKMRFRCLQRYRTLHFEPDKCGNIIVACAILHNICLEYNVPQSFEEETIENELEILHLPNDEEEPPSNSDLLAQARRMRQSLVRRVFAA